MDSFQDQPMLECLIKSRNVNDILFLVEQIANQLLGSMGLHFFTHKQKIIIGVVKVPVLGYIHLKEVAPYFAS